MEAPHIDLTKYREIVVLTGAGISVASGLPTYRGKGGIWSTIDVEKHATAAAIRDDPHGVWRFFSEVRARIAATAPNAAHLALAEAESTLSSDQRWTILTQNVDGLHRRAGSRRVVELHGTLHRSRCTRCDYARDEDLASTPAECPACPRCGAPMRADVVLFDEELPVDAEWESKKSLRNCDLFIAVGTSGTVWPASNFVRAAAYASARTIYVNVEPLQVPDSSFQEQVIGPAEDLLPKMFGSASQTSPNPTGS